MYRKEMKVYDAWLNERVEKEKRLAEIEVVIAALPLAVERLQAAQQYEAAHARYAEESERFHTLLGEITAKSADRDGWRAAREALADLRGRIKTYLVPSLNRVASHLLAQMTGGQRSSIVVDEEFNVTVDGQRLDTLSGSGKACSNLALRIGLGQVLTNNVVSVFVGDEIDASMDADRARSTQNSIAKLTASISQILIISHKEVDVSMVMRVAAGDVPVDVEIGEQALPALSR
jgi:DNA repair exonuclease SbcCD ATPase subunit